MSASSSQWSNLLKTEFSPSEQWPDISTKKSKTKTQKTNFKMSPLDLNKNDNPTLNNKIEQLRKIEKEPDNNYDRNADTRTREQIQEERVQRKADRAQQKKDQTYQQQLINLRSNKSEKIKLINAETMTKIMNCRNQDTTTTTTVQRISSNKPKRKIQNLEINLMDLVIDTTKRKQQQQQRKSQDIRINKGGKTERIGQRNKGKKREIPKKKWLSSLKKSILLSRQLNREKLKQEHETTAETAKEIVKFNEDVDEVTHINSDNKDELVKEVIPPVPCVNVPDSSSENVYKFSRKFRPYCTNFITPELCELTEALLKDLFRFQDRAYQKNQIKARATRRFVVGFKETQRQLSICKLKLLIIAPDLERSQEPGGLNDTIDCIKSKCRECSIPYVFSLGRWRIGHILLKKVPVACVGIINYDGSENNINQLLPLIQTEKQRFLNAGKNADELKVNK